MDESIRIGKRVKIFLDSKFGNSEGWFEEVVVHIDPYSEHRNFYWVELDEDARAMPGIKQISVFNPKNIKKIRPEVARNTQVMGTLKAPSLTLTATTCKSRCNE